MVDDRAGIWRMMDNSERIDQIERFRRNIICEMLGVCLKEADVVAKPKTSALRLARARDSDERSTAVTSAPARAKFIVSVPIPQPISRTFLPRHFQIRQRQECAVRRNTFVAST